MTDSVPGRADADSVPAGAGGSPIEAVAQELRGLRKSFDSKIRYDEVRENLVQAMGEELTRYRQDFHRSLLRPLLLDMIALYDDLTQVIDSPDTSAATARTLGFFRDSVEQALARNGVEKFTGKEGLDRSRQRVLDTVDTTDAALGRTIAQRLRAGFTWDGKVLRPEWVSIYRHVTGGTGGATGGVDDLPAPEPAAGAPAAAPAGDPEYADRPGEGAPR